MVNLSRSHRKIRGVRLRLLAVALIASAVIIPSGVGPAKAANGAVTYNYDALGRVLSANYDNGVVVEYTYDSNGNRTAQIINVNTSTLVWQSSSGACSAGTCWDQSLWQ